MTTKPIIHADTPQDLLDALIIWAQSRQLDAATQLRVPNMSNSTKNLWIMRERETRQFKEFLASIVIAPRSPPIITPVKEPPHA